MKLDELIDLLDDTDHGLTTRDFSKRLVQYLRPWSEVEKKAITATNLPADSDLRREAIDGLWEDFDALDKEMQARRRLFIGLLAPSENLNSYSGDMMVSFSESAGIREEDIACALSI
jgi:hypothetical protein